MIWYTDCKSTYDALQRPVQAKVQDKRLGIECASLRQSLWRAVGSERVNTRLLNERPAVATDIAKWIDTTVMPADPLTKSISADFLLDILAANYWDDAQPLEAKADKATKGAGRKRCKAAGKEINESFSADEEEDRDPHSEAHTPVPGGCE